MEINNNSSNQEIDFEMPGFIRRYKSGRVERYMGTAVVSPSFDSATGVDSKDVIIETNTGLSARLYLPPINKQDQKLTVLLFVHGGAFCIESSKSPNYHVFLNTVSSKANVLIISVEYRLAPEHPLPAAYEDCWDALEWIFANMDGIKGDKGTTDEPWIAEHGNKDRVFVVGDSAGANISHYIAIRAGEKGIPIKGAVLIHPFFWGSKPIGSENEEIHKRTKDLWKFVCPGGKGIDDPWINPTADDAPTLDKIGCPKLMVCVAELDFLVERGKWFYEKVKECGKRTELLVSEGQRHVFFLSEPQSEKTNELVDRLVEFFNRD